MLKLEDEWVWDSWPFTDTDGVHHLYFLQADRSLKLPILRHSHSRVGHATSRDWRHWTLQPDALLPSAGPGWDDLTIWTGCVVRGPDRFHMFYTGTSAEQGICVQRIGRADSEDLTHWQRFGTEALLTADPRWYESVDGRNAHEQTWRDPWIVPDPAGNGWHMFITARAPGHDRGRGVVGHAVSGDLDTWQTRPPLSKPGPFDHLEVVQSVLIEGRHHLLISCDNSATNGIEHSRGSSGGIYLIPGSGPLGPWDEQRWRKIDHRSLYAARLIDDDGTPSLLGFRDIENDHFVGELADPIPVSFRDPGERQKTPERSHRS